MSREYDPGVLVFPERVDTEDNLTRTVLGGKVTTLRNEFDARFAGSGIREGAEMIVSADEYNQERWLVNLSDSGKTVDIRRITEEFFPVKGVKILKQSTATWVCFGDAIIPTCKYDTYNGVLEKKHCVGDDNTLVYAGGYKRAKLRTNFNTQTAVGMTFGLIKSIPQAQIAPKHPR